MKKHRIQLLLILLSVFAAAMLYMNLRYDPLARNTSVTAANRSQLLHYLDDNEIRYLVENNVDVNVFLEFIEEPMFQLEHYRLYRSAMDLKRSSTKEVVTFINAVAGKIDVDELLRTIPNYEYATLRKLIVDQSPYSYHATIVTNPYDLETNLDMNHTIGEFAPNDLVELSKYESLNFVGKNFRLRQEAAESLDRLCRFLEESTAAPCGGFVVDQAYLSYHETQDAYLQSVQKEGAQAAFDEWGMPSHNEHQLGLAVDLVIPDIAVSLFVMDDAYHLLSASASTYGYIVYPNDAVVYDHNRRPYHFRYVGVDAARSCFEDGICFYHPKTE